MARSMAIGFFGIGFVRGGGYRFSRLPPGEVIMREVVAVGTVLGLFSGVALKKRTFEKVSNFDSQLLTFPFCL